MLILLELRALSLLNCRPVSTTRDQAVGLALQGIRDDIGEHLGRSSIALNLNADAHTVSVDSGGSRVALHLDASRDIVSIQRHRCRVTGNLQVAFDDVACAQCCSGANKHRSTVALIDKTAGDSAAADLVRSRTLWQALDREVAVDRSGGTDREVAAARYGYAASDFCAVKDDHATRAGDAPGCASTHKDAGLSFADRQISFEGAAVCPVASRAR